MDAQVDADLNPDQTPVLLFGTGELPRTIAAYVNHGSDGKFRVVGFTCDREFLPSDRMFLECPVVPFDKSAIDEFKDQFSIGRKLKLLLPVGYRDCNRLRERKYREAKEWGSEFASYVHPSVQRFPDVTIGENSIILDHVSVQSGVVLGHSSIIWPQSIVGHGSKIGSCCWLAARTVIAGQCQVGDRVFFGAGSIIQNSISIADDCIIGLGATITKSTKAKEVYLAGVNKRFFRKSENVDI